MERILTSVSTLGMQLGATGTVGVFNNGRWRFQENRGELLEEIDSGVS